jgi:beta-lactamase regulating signal transducer with metallopeptidase domain
MTAAWMLYAILVTSLVALAAATLDRLFAIWRVPRRYLWLGAMIIAVAAPFVAATRNAPTRLLLSPIEQPAVRTASLARPASTIAPRFTVPGMRALRRADRPARILWMASSTIALAALLSAFVVLRMRRASWPPATVDGHRTWIATDVGPAVVGWMRPRIVLPQWALQLGDTDRGWVLRHESEHIRAGDPRLLLVATLLLVAMPWNPALWWMTRRLRLAMEIDCDARVLRDTHAIHEYGMLLLAVSERRGHTLPLVASLTEQRGTLERRILAMTAPRPRYPRLVSAALGLLACTAAIAVAQTPVPDGADDRAASHATPRADGQQTVALMGKLVTQHYPAVMQGASSINRITFVLDGSGNYVTSKAWTDSAMLRRTTATMASAHATGAGAQGGAAKRTFESVRMIIGPGVRSVDGTRTLPPDAAGRSNDLGYLGPDITSDAVMSTRSALSRAPSALAVSIVQLKK